MKEYPKIQTIYFRDLSTKRGEIIEGQWSLPEFELLKDILWTWTEKIDGTNIRIGFNGTSVEFGGRTSEAQIPTFLLKVLQETFTPEKLNEVFPDLNGEEVCLYGEGYGNKIQKSGSHYLPDSSGFILFDCKIGQWWRQRESLEDIAKKLSIGIVPIVGTGTLLQAVEFIKSKPLSVTSHNKEFIVEGLVMKPQIDLFTRTGHRIIAKLKVSDFNRK